MKIGDNIFSFHTKKPEFCCLKGEMASTNYDDLKDLNVAILHYWFVTWRGGEKVVKSILDLFPKADVYTLFYDEDVCGQYLKGHRVFTSKFNLPFLKNQYQKLFPFYPKAVESIQLQDDYDLIISSESGPIKGVPNPNKIPHLCYIHSPMRYCWGGTETYLKTLPKIARPTAKKAFKNLREWDETTINHVDHYIANSINIQKRVKKYYKRDSSVCYPPITLDHFEQKLEKKKKKDYFLSFGAVTPYKRIDLLGDTFREMKDEKLIVIGDGSERKKLAKKAPENVSFLGQIEWEQIYTYIKNAKALLFPGEEDFGMIPLEVMAYGIPVIAYNKGGALETVVEDKEKIHCSSGLFFKNQSVNSLKKAIEFFNKVEADFDPKWIKKHARSFGEDCFQEKFASEVRSFLEEKKKEIRTR